MVTVAPLTHENVLRLPQKGRDGELRNHHKDPFTKVTGKSKGGAKGKDNGKDKGKKYGKGKGKGYGKEKGKNYVEDDGKGGKHRQQQWVKGKEMVKGSPDSKSGEPRYHKDGLVPVSPSSRSPATPAQLLSQKGSSRAYAYERRNPYQRLRTSPEQPRVLGGNSFPGEPEWTNGFGNPFQPETEPSGTWYCPSSGFVTADSQ
jgi:hypothetical protein